LVVDGSDKSAKRDVYKFSHQIDQILIKNSIFPNLMLFSAFQKKPKIQIILYNFFKS